MARGYAACLWVERLGCPRFSGSARNMLREPDLDFHSRVSAFR